MRISRTIRDAAARHARSLRMLSIGLALVGYLLCLVLLVGHGMALSGGGGGADTLAYWTAGGDLLAGRPIYGVAIGGYAAYLYPPPLAQLFAPLSLLPFPVVVWLWRAVLVGCLRLVAGSWVRAGLVLLLWPPLIAELDAGNVHLLIAAAVAMAIRGRPDFLFAAALTKFASLAAVPLAAARRPRRLAAAAALTTGVVVLSFVLAPSLWFDFATYLRTMPSYETGWYDIGRGIPPVLRLGASGLLAVAAIRWPRLAAVAATLALPVLWVSGLSILVSAMATPGSPAPARERVLEPRPVVQPAGPGSRPGVPAPPMGTSRPPGGTGSQPLGDR